VGTWGALTQKGACAVSWQAFSRASILLLPRRAIPSD
jgi:hypothetical protein